MRAITEDLHAGPRARDAASRPAALAKLRPAKIRTAARRRWFEYRVPRSLRLRSIGGLVDVGSRPGGWTFPTDLIRPSWVCYMVGAGGDIAVDLDLIRGWGVSVRAFDAVESYVRLALEHAAGEERFSAHHAAIAPEDGPLMMQVTHHPGSSSVSPAGLYESTEMVELPGRSLPSLMAELGDERIDLLKLDIEGGEYELLPQLDLRAPGVQVFAVQLHHNGSVSQALDAVAGLRRQGYEPVACRPAVKITFVRSELL